MGSRIRSFVAVTASCVVLTAGDSAHAQPPTKPTKPTKTNAPDASKPGGAAQPKPEPAPLVWTVCVRPEEVDKNINEWTFGETHKPVATDVARTAKLSRHPIFKFDKNASLDSPKKFPGQYRELKCPNDDRKPEAPEEPQPAAIPILGSYSSAFPSSSILGAGSLASSGTGKSTSTLVNQFVQTAQQFNLAGTPDEINATQFATKLRDSITNKTPLPKSAVDALDLNAATILAKAFGESLAAAMAKQSVIGPLNVLQKMVPTGKNAAFGVFTLIGTGMMEGYDLNPADELPSVILPLADFQQRTSAINALIQGRLPPEILHDRLKQAYGDKPAWLAAIAHLF